MVSSPSSNRRFSSLLFLTLSCPSSLLLPRTRTFHGHLPPFHLAGRGPRRGFPAGRMVQMPKSAPLFALPQNKKGALGPKRHQAAAPLAGVMSTFPGRAYSPRARCFRRGIPNLGTAGKSPGLGIPVPARNLGRSRLVSQDPYPALP